MPGPAPSDVGETFQPEAGQPHLDRREAEHVLRVDGREPEDGRATDVLAREVNRADIEVIDQSVQVPADVALSKLLSALLESPKPRRSTANTRWVAAGSGMSLWKAHQVSGKPWTSRIGDPVAPAAT